MDTLLISKIRTVSERDRLLVAIEAVEKNKYALKSEVPLWASEIIGKEMKDDTYIKELKAALIGLKVLKLVVAFDPTETSVDKIHTYLGGKYILDFEYDPKVIGGAVIMAQGEYRDYSIKKTLWTTLEAI